MLKLIETIIFVHNNNHINSIMKKITILLNTFIALLLFSSCSSDDGAEQKKTDENKYSFTYSILVTDSDGNNLLSKEYFEYYDVYGENNILLNTEEENEATFVIAPSENDRLQMNVTVDTYGEDGTNIHTMTVQWGTGNMATVDNIKCEIEKNGATTYCSKIWVNNELKWEDNAQSEQPSFSLVKPRNITHLPDAKPISLKLAEKVSKDNTFALDIFKATYKEASEKDEPNVSISPLSISYALNMMVNGAVGETQNQIIETLKAKGYSVDQINEYSKDLAEALKGVDPSTSLTLANSIWHAPKFSIKENFISTNRTYYDAEVNILDFTSSDAVSILNGWCAEKTNNKIPETLDEINPQTVMMLINALYFKSGWTDYYKFEKMVTTTDDFYPENSSTQKVNMMRATSGYPYASDENASYLAIPFGNKAFSMVFAIPQTNKTIKDVIDNLNINTWKTYLSMSSTYIALRLPRFKTECSYYLEETILPAMGMTLPLTSSADYSGISDSELYFNSILHKTFVEVNEDGAEAAAITIGDWVTSPGDEPIPLDFHINKPFIFAIQENSTGLILFMGKIGEIME